MSSPGFVILLLCAQIMGRVSVLLNATIGGSVLIPCSLPVNSINLTWFYWQEHQSNNILFHWHTSEKTQDVAKEYRNRCQVFKTEFSSGNISIRLNNVSVGDDQKTFLAYVGFYDEQKKVSQRHEQICKSSLQVSAPYQDLVLTINNTVNSAACTARGGYPEPRVSWTGQNRSSGEPLDLQNAQTSLQQDPTEKTFSVRSTVSVKELQSVTCLVYNPRSNQRINSTTVINAPGEDLMRNHSTIDVLVGVGVVVVILLLFVCCLFFYKRRCKKYNSRCQRAVNQTDSAADEDSAGRNAPVASEGNILLVNQAVSCRNSVRRDAAADNASNEDTSAAAATADTEEETNFLNNSKEDLGETKSTESDKDK